MVTCDIDNGDTDMKPYELTGEKLKAYRCGFSDGNELSHYYPAGLHEATYKWGYRDGVKYGPRKGKSWTLRELQQFNNGDER